MPTFEEFLKTQGCENIIIRDGVWYSTTKFMYTSAIICGREGEQHCYENRWCYHNPVDALVALLEWKERGFDGEPNGWHRHPMSGRRRENGDPSTEYINP